MQGMKCAGEWTLVISLAALLISLIIIIVYLMIIYIEVAIKPGKQIVSHHLCTLVFVCISWKEIYLGMMLKLPPKV